VEAADVARLERATVAGVAPRGVEEADGWILALDAGPMGRACSAAPLSHDPPPPLTPALADAYAAAGLAPAFRLPDLPVFSAARDLLREGGFRPGEPTWVMTADPLAVAGYAGPGAGGSEPVLLEAPDAAWTEAFCGHGFDAREGAQRVAQLARSPGAVFGAIREGERTLAVGVLSRAGGLGGVHGMRTPPDQRGRGHAGSLLAAFGRQTADWGLPGIFLQVEAGNPARRLYKAAGFAELWRYWYWR
jgi:GNAT superfamily N-acetyltransferase